MSLLACWNLKQGRGDAVIPGLEALDGALCIGLLERNGNRSAVGKWRRQADYPKSIAGTGVEAGSTMLLIREDVRVYDHGLITVRGAWRGPRRGHHPGRTFPWACVDLDGDHVTVAVIHFPWNRTLNWRAWSACIRALIAFCRAHRGPLVLMGDWNLSWRGRGLGSIRRLARRCGLTYVSTGGAIDYALARGIDLDGHTGPRYGSDHHSARYDRETR